MKKSLPRQVTGYYGCPNLQTQEDEEYVVATTGNRFRCAAANQPGTKTQSVEYGAGSRVVVHSTEGHGMRLRVVTNIPNCAGTRVGGGRGQ